VTVLGEPEAAAVRELFAGLERDVSLLLELGPSSESVTVLSGRRELDPGAEIQPLLEALAELSDRVRLDVLDRDQPGRYPAVTIGEGLRYHGLPWGYELSSLVYGIAEAGRRQPSLSEQTLAELTGLEHDLEIEVYVTPT
jgi:alkyl hydroperoxide reductase subunit AhpF